MVFAGVFDPVHRGHISAAERALLYGNTVVFLPERVPQHKHGTTAYEHRLNMLRIATRYNPQFIVLDYPYDNQWIAQTFTWLNEQYPDRKISWLVGSDVVSLIATWPDSDKLSTFNVTEIIKIKRLVDSDLEIQKVHDTPIALAMRPRKQHESLSSTWIREALEHRHTALPDGVWEYIKENNLYT